MAVLTPDDLSAAVEVHDVSAFAAQRLPGAELSGSLETAELGQRLTLALAWDEPRRREAPLTMTAWVFADNDRAATSAEDEP